jgi:hypothetical protein
MLVDLDRARSIAISNSNTFTESAFNQIREGTVTRLVAIRECDTPPRCRLCRGKEGCVSSAQHTKRALLRSGPRARPRTSASRGAAAALPFAIVGTQLITTALDGRRSSHDTSVRKQDKGRSECRFNKPLAVRSRLRVRCWGSLSNGTANELRPKQMV